MSYEGGAGEFRIPDAVGGPVHGHEYYAEQGLIGKLEGCKQELMLRGVEALEVSFPVLHLVVRKFSELGSPVRELCWSIVMSELKVHVNVLEDCDMSKLELDKKRLLRNATKVLSYVSAGLAEGYEGEAIHKQFKEKKGKHTTNSWEEERLKLIFLLVNLGNLEIVKLWEPPSVPIMEDLTTLFANVCYKFLENPAVVRDKVLLGNISSLLGITVKKYGLTMSASLKLVQLLQHFEHLVTPIGNIVVAIATECSCKQLVLDVFREICSMDPSDLSLDSSGTKSFASFQVLVTGLVPSLVLPALPVLLPHLNGESTTFRNGVLGVIGELLRLLPDSSGGEDILLPETRDQLLLKLADHLHDVNAFVRAKVLHILLQLCSVQGIPLPLLQGLVEKVTERLKDKSSLVRKGCLQLLCAMLSSNPFAAKLDKEVFKNKLDEENAILSELSHDDESVKHVAVAQYLQAALDFTAMMSQCVPIAVELMRSKVISDVLESVEFLCVAKRFELDGSAEAISKSLPLVWSQDERLRNAVVSAYVHLYLTNNTHSKQKDHASQVVQNLLQILCTATLGELASLEKLVGLFVSEGHVPTHALKELWQLYKSGRTPEESRILSCQLLSMAFCTDNSGASVSTSLDDFVSSGVVESSDLILAKHTCSAINKLAQSGEGFRLSNDHSVFYQISSMLTSNFKNLETTQWIPLCEQGVTLIYQLSEQPNSVAEILLRDLSMLSDFDGGIDSIVLSRLLFCVGHVAQCQVVHCEHNIIREKKKAKEKNCPSTTQGELEEELGIGGGDEQESDFVRGVMETEVGGAGGMLATFEPLLVCIVSNPSRYCCDRLQTAAALSLSKFLLISSTVCQKYLQLFFTVLEKSSFISVRANLIIAASDLVCRFPNIIEPWTPFLYNRLKDDSNLVRKNTMMVLTHLILNDMIKIRGQISAMALCLEDTNPIIKELAQIFFYELSQKGNNLYNVLPDIISQLTDPDGSKCPQDSFRSIVRHLFQLIKKERHHESLMEKLCHRLRAARTEEQGHDLAYCLSLFTPTEKGLIKLQQNFSCYQDKLCDEVVSKHLLAYVNKAKKTGKLDVKAHGEDLEKKICEVMKSGSTEALESLASPTSPVGLT